MATEKASITDDEAGFLETVTDFSVTPFFPFNRSRPHAAMGELLKLQNHHLCTPSSKKTVVCVLRARRYVGSSAQALQAGVTSDGKGNGPVRRVARGVGESTLLGGGCVEED
jgi:hypothetical protein